MTLLYIVGMDVVSWSAILCIIAIGLSCFFYSSPALDAREPPAISTGFVDDTPRPDVDKIWMQDDVGTPGTPPPLAP